MHSSKNQTGAAALDIKEMSKIKKGESSTDVPEQKICNGFCGNNMKEHTIKIKSKSDEIDDSGPH